MELDELLLLEHRDDEDEHDELEELLHDEEELEELHFDELEDEELLQLLEELHELELIELDELLHEEELEYELELLEEEELDLHDDEELSELDLDEELDELEEDLDEELDELELDEVEANVTPHRSVCKFVGFGLIENDDELERLLELLLRQLEEEDDELLELEDEDVLEKTTDHKSVCRITAWNHPREPSLTIIFQSATTTVSAKTIRSFLTVAVVSTPREPPSINIFQ